MNTKLSQRATALASAAFFTLVMLLGINGLATSPAQPIQLAAVSAPASAAHS